MTSQGGGKKRTRVLDQLLDALDDRVVSRLGAHADIAYQNGISSLLHAEHERNAPVLSHPSSWMVSLVAFSFSWYFSMMFCPPLHQRRH